jgi:hypothetical protein
LPWAANGVDVMGFEFAGRAPVTVGDTREGSPEAAFAAASRREGRPRVPRAVAGDGALLTEPVAGRALALVEVEGFEFAGRAPVTVGDTREGSPEAAFAAASRARACGRSSACTSAKGALAFHGPSRVTAPY